MLYDSAGEVAIVAYLGNHPVLPGKPPAPLVLTKSLFGRYRFRFAFDLDADGGPMEVYNEILAAFRYDPSPDELSLALEQAR